MSSLVTRAGSLRGNKKSNLARTAYQQVKNVGYIEIDANREK